MVNCSGITLAPLNVNHPKMADDVKKAALPVYPNLWDSPLEIREGSRSSASEKNAFKNLDPRGKMLNFTIHDQSALPCYQILENLNVFL